MKWYRFFFLVALLALLGSCKNPTLPPYPEEEETEDEDIKQKGGFVLLELPVYWV